MRVQEMIMSCIVCGIMMVARLLDVVEGESGRGGPRFGRFSFFLFLSQPLISRCWWISTMDWMTGAHWGGIPVRTCAGRQESTATGLVLFPPCKFGFLQVSKSGGLHDSLSCRDVNGLGLKGTLPAGFAQLSEVIWM